MAREFVVQFLSLVGPFVLAMLAAIASYLAPLARRLFAQRLIGSAVELLGVLAATAVANAYQTVVKDLKDPSKPGVWSAEAAASVKASVLRDLRVLGAGALQQLETHGLGPAAVDALLNQLVESAVVDLEHRVSPTLPHA